MTNNEYDLYMTDPAAYRALEEKRYKEKQERLRGPWEAFAVLDSGDTAGRRVFDDLYSAKIWAACLVKDTIIIGDSYNGPHTMVPAHRVKVVKVRKADL